MDNIQQSIFSTAYNYFTSTMNDNVIHATFLANCMVAQSKHESANYSSALFIDDNNSFGYNYVGQTGAAASTRHMNGATPYAHYNSVADSALEIAKWIGRRWASFSAVYTLAAYEQALKDNGYYGDSYNNYYAGLSHFYTDAKPATNYASVLPFDTSVIIPVAAAAGLYLLLKRFEIL